MYKQIGERKFSAICVVDFEFSASPGEPASPICMVVRELVSGNIKRVWEDELLSFKHPPFPVGPDALFVAYYASAELVCHLALGWTLPANVLDLYVEFRNHTNGLSLPCGNGLIGAMTYYGLDGMEAMEKEEMRELAIRGGPWTKSERDGLLDYCAADVNALTKLFREMTPDLDVSRALLRGRYMKAASRMEHVGIPVDVDTLSDLRENWSAIRDSLIERIDVGYNVYVDGSFKRDLWEAWLVRNGISWPRLPSGALALDADTFKEMARAHPLVGPLRELRLALSQLRLHDLSVGCDGRNRCLLSPFSSRTGRNQPSNAKFIFGPAVWLRSLIRPGPGYGLAYIDWGQQEVGIAAALSGDERMMEAYRTGDPYLEFGKQTGAIPQDATKLSHSHLREQFKACVLAVQYGMGELSLSERIGQSPAHARELLRMHKETYSMFWHWSEAAVNLAMLKGRLHTVFGWNIQVGPKANSRSLRNFPMQANGAEMLRLACCLATERGVRVCAPVHDAVLIEAPLTELDEAVASMKRSMDEASETVLDGFRLHTDAKTVTWPHRYSDERGEQMWQTVQEILSQEEHLVTA